MKSLICFVIGIFIFASCTNMSNPCGVDKDQFLNNYDKLVREVENQNMSIDNPEWETKDQQFNTFTKECYPQYKEQLTAEEKEQYFENTVEYYVYKYGEGLATEFQQEGDQIIDKVRNRIENWKETDGEELERKIESAVNEIQAQVNEDKMEAAFDRFVAFLEGIDVNMRSSEPDTSAQDN